MGGLASLAANIAHCYLPPPGVPATPAAGWSPEPGAVISAMFWPVALFIAVEILVRTPWPSGRGWLLARFGGLLPVALVAAVVSYRHLSGLLHHYGEDGLTAIAGPAAVDGLMVMAAAALLASTTRTPAAPTPTPQPAPAAPTPAAPAPAAARRTPELLPGQEHPVAPVRASNGAIPSGVIR